jgi:hypothetical protein
MAINCALYFGDDDGWVTVAVTVAAAAAAAAATSTGSLSKHKQDDSEVVAARSSENFGG